MRIFNLTDVSTSALKAAGLENVSITVNGVAIVPGESAEVKGPHTDVSRLFHCSALAYEQPDEYLRAKGLKVLQAAPVPVRAQLNAVVEVEVTDSAEASAQVEVVMDSSITDTQPLSKRERKRLRR